MALLFSTFATVFLLAMQQQIVVAGHYGLAAITSAGIAAAQITMVRQVIQGKKLRAFFLTSAGGVTGVELAMLLFRNT